MNYDIAATLEFLPYVAWVVLGVTLIILEIRAYQSSGQRAPGDTGFVPPRGDGYRYYVDSESVVYIHRRSANQFRIYVIEGRMPVTALRHDACGSYFTVYARDASLAEEQIDRLYAV